MNMCTRGCENRNVQGSYCMYVGVCAAGCMIPILSYMCVVQLSSSQWQTVWFVLLWQHGWGGSGVGGLFRVSIPAGRASKLSLWAWQRERERVGDRKKKQALKFKLCKNRRYRRTAVGLPGRGVCPAGEHREVQQPPLRKEQERRFRARGQLPAERAGPARRAAGGLPLQLRDVAGERGLLAANPVGGPTTESITYGEGGKRGGMRAWGGCNCAKVTHWASWEWFKEVVTSSASGKKELAAACSNGRNDKRIKDEL